jgi:hypothetical protein
MGYKRNLQVHTVLREKCKELIIDNSQLEEYKKKLLNDLNKGLGKKTHPTSIVKCFITYVQDLPDGTGKFVVFVSVLQIKNSNKRSMYLTKR